MRNKISISGQQNTSAHKRRRFSGLISTSLLMILLIFTAWQCREDDFTGEITGVCPEVIATSPLAGAVNVVSNKQITATFNEAMNPASINETTFLLKKGVTMISGTVTYTGVIATFTPTDLLDVNTVYSATIKRESKDLMGNIMVKDTTWSFTTIPPVIVQYTVALSSSPSDGGSTTGTGLFNAGTSVTVGANPNAGFSFEKWTEGGVQASTLANYTFTLNNNRTLVANFAAIVSGPPGVNLGSAGNFAILAGTGISNTGVTTVITGDAGSFPTATINGLLSGNVVGTLYVVADPIVGVAKGHLTTAYNDAQARSLDAISLPGQLGGLTLAPGLYVNSSTSGISGTGANGILTLNAGGNPNSVWIFKMGSTLITGSGTSIVLAGGAKAKNIYWSVGTSATLGTNSIFFGNILADQSITLTTGASLTGRALTRIGAVTLDTNVVTKP